MRRNFLYYFVFPGLTVVFIFFYIFFVYRPLKNTLQEKVEKEFVHEITLKSQYLDNELIRTKEGAKAISSRSMIRNKIVEYRDGKIPFSELKEYTTPKYLEGIKTLKNCFFAQRIVGDSIVAMYGNPEFVYIDDLIADTINRTLKVCATIKGSNLKAGVVSPIFHDTSIVGYDIICLENPNIVDNIKNDQIDFDIYSLVHQNNYISGENDTLKHFQTELSHHTNNLSLYLVKSTTVNAYFQFSIVTNELYAELEHFKKQQLLFLIMASGLLIFVMMLILRMTKQWYARKGKYYEELASKKELELVKSHNEYKQLFELVPVGIVVVNKEGIITNNNPEAIRIMKLHKKGQYISLADVQSYAIHKDGNKITSEEFASIRDVNEQKHIKNEEIGIKHNNGDITWLKVSVVPKITGDGEIVSFTDITEEITNEKKLEILLRDLEKANATKDKFFSIISHDLRSPLGSIKNLLEMCHGNIAEDNYDDIEKYILILKNTATKSYELLENLLHWSRIQTKNIKFNPRTLVFKEVVRGLVDLLATNIEEKHLKLNLNIPESLKIHADAFMVETIMRNLLSNAIKYTPENGEITITAKEDEDKIVISVSDTGTGISKENIDRLFKIEDNFSTLGINNETGTGLGLILCKEFVEMHGGEIRVESVEGKGSTFTFSLMRK